MPIKTFLKLLRPEQWTKNLFVFLPLFFSGQLMNLSMFTQCIVAFVAFSFAASSIYCFNDMYDVETDRLHPKKCKRPIASGAISSKQAKVVMVVCLLLAMTILFLFGGTAKYMLMALITLYYVMNLAYCIKLKSYAIVDVMVIAIGFVLRILVGGTATEIWLSEWIMMMTFLLALFLAFAKRRDDVVLFQHTGVLPRKNTKRYNLEFLNQVMTIVSTVTIVAYIMYTISPDVMAHFKSRNIYFTAVFVLGGILRYLQVTIVDLQSGNPTTILLKDRFIQLCIAGWIILFMLIIYV